jgi:hypothetical protein
MNKCLLAVLLLAPCAACAARTPDMYARDTGAVLATKNDAIRACYDGVLKTTPTAKGRVTITFDVETDGGRITNVAVDAPATSAPMPVADCVTQNLTGLAVQPPDTRKGKGQWVYDFTPGAAVTASQGAPAQPGAPASGGPPG